MGQPETSDLAMKERGISEPTTVISTQDAWLEAISNGRSTAGAPICSILMPTSRVAIRCQSWGSFRCILSPSFTASH